MSVKKTIAIVGATEKNGTEITTRFAQTDYRLLLVSNDISKLTQLSKNISENKPTAEIDSIECVKDGCWEADIIILAVPSHEEKIVAEMMKEVATQKIVVSISCEESQNVELRHLLPYSKLVKVSGTLQLNNISIEGDDNEANEEIVNIFHSAGYHAVIANQFSSKQYI
jgi:8-hydroxy-5-deazaflavin:NADPH oxidoreductase